MLHDRMSSQESSHKMPNPATPPLSAWIEVPQFDWGTLTAGAPQVRLRKGQTLFSQGDTVQHVFVVDQGRVRMVLLTADGHEKHVAIIGTHGLLGESGAFVDGRHEVTAVASSDVVAWKVEPARLLRCMQEDRNCLTQVVWLMGVKVHIVTQQNLLLSHASATQRVVHHLLQLAHTYGMPAGKGTAIQISFTHQEMANIAGLSRVMTSNVLLQLQAEGLLEKEGAHCVIRDLRRLGELAGA